MAAVAECLIVRLPTIHEDREDIFLSSWSEQAHKVSQIPYALKYDIRIWRYISSSVLISAVVAFSSTA